MSLSPEFLSRATSAFEMMIDADGYKLTRNIRIARKRSRRTIDPTDAAFTSSPTDLDYFLNTDPFTQASGFEVLTPEPIFVNGQNTPTDQAYALIASRYRYNSQEVFAVDPLQVNQINGILTDADSRVIQGAAVVMGPTTFDDALEGERSMRVSTTAGGGDLLGGMEGEARYAYEAQPVYVAPGTTVSPKIRIAGGEFAGRNVTVPFNLTWELTMLVANVAKKSNKSS